MSGFAWRRHFPFLLLAAAITTYHFAGLGAVPFHPDETSLLYQSRDLETLLRAPLRLAWDPALEGDYDQTYRALNPPLPKWVLGVGRRLAGYGPDWVAVDWDWSLSWQENVARGALPPEGLLWGARAASVALLPLTLAALYWIGLRLEGRALGLTAVVFFGLNALTLLHTRRAMAEGTLALGVSLAVALALEADRRPWLAGMAGAMAVASKLSAAPLALVGLVGALWSRTTAASPLDRAGAAARYLTSLIVGILLLHPFLWSNPPRAALEMWQARQALLSEQTTTLEAILPGQAVDTPVERLAATLGQLFLNPPQLAEVGNYLEATQAMDQAYLANPLHRLGRGSVGGGLVMVLTLYGWILGSLRARHKGGAYARTVALLSLATAVEGLALFVTLSLPFQRYYIPLVPLLTLWMALPPALLLRAGKQRLLRGRSNQGPLPRGSHLTPAGSR